MLIAMSDVMTDDDESEYTTDDSQPTATFANTTIN